MKCTFSKAVMLGFVLGTTATSALANQVSVTNTSSMHPKPITVMYQTAQQNPGQPPVLSQPLSMDLKKGAGISLFMVSKDYKYSGLVINSIDGLPVPSEFGKMGCTIATDAQHPDGGILLEHDGKETFKCKTYGGTKI